MMMSIITSLFPYTKTATTSTSGIRSVLLCSTQANRTALIRTIPGVSTSRNPGAQTRKSNHRAGTRCLFIWLTTLAARPISRTLLSMRSGVRGGCQSFRSTKLAKVCLWPEGDSPLVWAKMAAAAPKQPVRKTPMITSKLLLQILLVSYIAVVIVHNTVEHYYPPERFWLSWTYLLGMGYGLSVVIYAFSLRCVNCKARQVFRGFSFLDIRWPEETCHKCGESTSRASQSELND